MNCNHFGECGSCTLYEKNYDEQLHYKVAKIKALFNLKELDVLTSLPQNFRFRAEFRIFHNYDQNSLSYAMHTLEKKGLLSISSCQIVSPPIATLMPKLLEEIQKKALLKEKLFGVEFLSSTKGELLVTLIYHKRIDESWKEEAQKLAEKLEIALIGRSRGVRLVVNKEYIEESLMILGKHYHFRLYDTGFTQPNSYVNQKMISWVKERVDKENSDLLELYCGHGNFTIPLSENFSKVLATEISKRSIKSALENCMLNGIENISFVRLSSQELTEAMQGVRKFQRLKGVDLKSYRFSHIFVDPPRAGLDDQTLQMIQDYPNIIYISCNPVTLKRDLETLTKMYEIANFAVFDQFAYTEHIECGVILKRK